MRGPREHAVRGAVVAALSALLLVLTGSAYGATAAPASHSGHGSSTVRATSTDTVPAVVPHRHRGQHLQRLDGSGPALLPDRARAPRPAYRTGLSAAVHDPLLVRNRGATHGRAPPA